MIDSSRTGPRNNFSGPCGTSPSKVRLSPVRPRMTETLRRALAVAMKGEAQRLVVALRRQGA